MLYAKGNDLYRTRLGSEAPELVLEPPGVTELDGGFGVAPRGDVVYYTRYDREVDIWMVDLR